MPRAASANKSDQPREVELKLAVAADDLPRLRQRLRRFGPGRQVEVDNVYFDTAERLLRSQRMALRLRRIGRRWLQTLKTETGTGALSTRGEWEVPAPRGRLDLRRFASTPLSDLLQSSKARLLPVFRTRFRRTIWNASDGAVEIALDEGEIVAGNERAPIVELELELKSGKADALYRLAFELAGEAGDRIALRPAVDSKAARGYRLAAKEAPAPAKANARAVVGTLTKDMTLATALHGVVERGTTLLLINAAGCASVGDPEFVHQARVAVRRIRSATRLLGKAAGWPAALDDELRWLARRLGAVRDWDVLQAQTAAALKAALPGVATPLVAQAAALRHGDDAALRSALAGARFARLTLRLLRWANTAAEGGPTLASSAGKRLRRLHRRLFDAAAFFAALPVEQQHRVRIRAKRLRYALDLYAAALPAKATARYIEQLAGLQDELGALNDAAVAALLLRQLGRAARADPAPALAWLEQTRQEHAMRAEAALVSLARLPLPRK